MLPAQRIKALMALKAHTFPETYDLHLIKAAAMACRSTNKIACRKFSLLGNSDNLHL